MDINEKVERYRECMEEIKRRVKVLEALLSGKFSTPYPITNTELACLQIRKILELAALAAVVANKLELETTQANLDRLWNAKEIVKAVQVVNPKHFPEPIELQCFNGDPNITRTHPAKAGYLTHEEFQSIYSVCGGLLHAQNPFAKKKRFQETYAVIGKWVEKIKKLLNQHVVNLVDETTMIMVFVNFDYEEPVSIGAYGVVPT
jgi:hypothetical protein